jgi:hypothetical protein
VWARRKLKNIRKYLSDIISAALASISVTVNYIKWPILGRILHAYLTNFARGFKYVPVKHKSYHVFSIIALFTLARFILS